MYHLIQPLGRRIDQSQNLYTDRTAQDRKTANIDASIVIEPTILLLKLSKTVRTWSRSATASGSYRVYLMQTRIQTGSLMSNCIAFHPHIVASLLSMPNKNIVSEFRQNTYQISTSPLEENQP
jgi:hypothetical protein